MNRKDFIKTAGVITAGTLVLPSCNMGSGGMKPGLQIWSVRSLLKEDFEGTIKKVAEVGYGNIEGYGLGPNGMFLGSIAPSHYARVIKDQGMELISTHCSYTIADKAGPMIEAAAETGMEYMIVPGIPKNLRETIDQWKEIAENMNRLGEMCIESGLKFGYHNHAFEFEKIDGLIPQEILIESTDAELVNFEADLFWVSKGGYDPLELIRKYPGRIRLLHVKDGNEEFEETTTGSGVIDFESILKAGRKDVVEHYFVEDERLDDPMQNIRDDFRYISTNQKIFK
ncbi:MAG: sugar phosphate isomerase/epimerase [Bacteroidetes bacterium]|nr:sugar phosphate isomerase/epimerase [Bacteroidota bacterium]